jgi:hypothetical protein
MSTTTGKRAARPKATARADQLRPLNLPQPVTVELDDAGLPSKIADSYRRTAVPPYRPDAEECNETTDRDPPGKAVETIIEIWHVDDEWWRDPIARRYVEVILEGGKHMVLYEDSTANRWFMQMP